MTLVYGDEMAQVYQGDARNVLQEMADQSVQVCVTSPPYFHLRNYGVDGQMGLEATIDEYLAAMVTVFAQVRRVLRDDGTLWLNMGDSYNAYNGNRGPSGSTLEGRRNNTVSVPRVPPGSGRSVKTLKNKDMVGMPWRLAFALQAAGWYLRSDIIWAKSNPMPESATDRPTKAHEYLFLLAKSERYYYDADAVKEPCVSGPSDVRKMVEALPRIGGKHKDLEDPFSKASSSSNIGRRRSVGDPSGRNRRSVWTIATQAYPDAHFATYPEALVEPCILAGSPRGGVVLDPFAGSGTTLAVANRLGRLGVGIELNPEYVKLIRKRLHRAKMGLGL